MLLVAGCAGLWLIVLFARHINKGTGWVAIGCGLALLTIHLAVEGPRWQLYPIYVVTVLLILWTAWNPGKSRLKRGGRKAGKYVMLIVFALIIISSATLSVMLPVVRLPAPTGAYPVGTRTFLFTDSEREERYTGDPNDNRELMVQMWYPAVKPEGQHPEPLVSGVGDPRTAKRFLQKFAIALELPDFALEYWKYFLSNSYRDAEMLRPESPYPVVLISHGMGTTRMLHVSQAENLASHGYVVAAIDHTYSTTATVFPDGRMTEQKAALDGAHFMATANCLGSIWTEDVSSVITRLDEMNSSSDANGFKDRLDMKHVGMMGHSFGGATAFHVVSSDERVIAGINMDGTNYDRYDEKLNTTKPFLFLESENFKQFVEKLRQVPSRDGQEYAIFSNEIELIGSAVRNGSKALYLTRSEHYNFTDLPLYSPLVHLTGMTGALDRERGAEIVNAYVLDFFDTYLKEKEPRLLKGPSSVYPEVKFDLDLKPMK